MSLTEIKPYPASVQVNCIDSTFPAEAVFQSEAKKLQQVQFKPGEQVTFEPHAGVFMIAKGRDCTILTKNLLPGKAVYNEERLSVQNEYGTEVEYRVWDPFRSDLAAAVIGGADNISIKPGAKVLYLGAASGTTVSPVSDIAGPAMILAHNPSFFLKMGGHFSLIINADIIT
ncbi:hypothetical protein F2Q70_00003017 [Brassica cretica]|uniref:Uncharacterized protein n=1 Tax=Brassica cretica TaxID=69181 RepID=A0A8S9ISS6_BRACR|nr:hypothetical protein F2Q70_00003017 [Brassica cretica]